MSIENQKHTNIERQTTEAEAYATAVAALEDVVKRKILSLSETPDIPVVVGHMDEKGVERFMHLDGYTEAPKYREPVSTTIVRTLNPDLDGPDWSTVEIRNGIAQQVSEDPENPSKKYYRKMNETDVAKLRENIMTARAVRGNELSALSVTPVDSFKMPEVAELANMRKDTYTEADSERASKKANALPLHKALGKKAADSLARALGEPDTRPDAPKSFPRRLE